MDPPRRLIERAVETLSSADAPRLAELLGRMAIEDPAFSSFVDPESGQTIVTGVSEAQVARKLEMLTDDYGLKLAFGSPQVAYRERLGCKADVDHTYSRQSGGGGSFARVLLTFEPRAGDLGFVFENQTSGKLPETFVQAVEVALAEASQEGLLAGFPVIGFAAVLRGGTYHDLDSTPSAFAIAFRDAFKMLRTKGDPRLIEPIMSVAVTGLDANIVSAVLADLITRRGQIVDIDAGDDGLVAATAPLSNLLGYDEALQKITGGRGRTELRFDSYSDVPTDFGSGPDLFTPAVGMRA